MRYSTVPAVHCAHGLQSRLEHVALQYDFALTLLTFLWTREKHYCHSSSLKDNVKVISTDPWIKKTTNLGFTLA